MVWNPQPGPQTSALLADFCDEIFYGGERGGGKSDFQLGYQEDGALRYGNKWRGIMFRKTYAELEELQGRACEIFPSEGAEYKAQTSAGYPFSNCWYWPNGATVKMRYIEHERDYGRYHGHQYCVGVGTPVLMANRTWQAIDTIRAGDRVMTLEGGKRVIAAHPSYLAPCVMMTTTDDEGRAIGRQIQPVWHPVLTSAGVAFESPRDEFQTGEPLLPLNDPWKSAQSLIGAAHTIPGTGASQEGGQTDSSAFEDAPQGEKQPVRLSFPLVLSELVVRSSQTRLTSKPRDRGKFGESCLEQCRSVPSSSREGLLRPSAQPSPLMGLARTEPLAAQCARGQCVPLGSIEAQDCPIDCLTGFRSCDELLPENSAVCQCFAPSQVGAEEQAHGASLSGETGCTRGHIRQGPYTYIHPYTRERRNASLPLVSGMAILEDVGIALVCDLTIEDANHYITSCGAINKNTGISFDEVTEYATPSGMLKMLSTLRSPHGVPCTMRATGNPGGIGHGWVKERYITSKTPMVPYKDPDTGFERMFIPSRTQDNQILLQADPDYRSRIKAATGGNEALRKAWLSGDWNIVAGAFFNDWNTDRHVVRPFEIPEHWMRFRSGDWGSAKPFSFGWWAVVSDDYKTDEGLTLPRGCMVRYREWYGIKQDEYGQKLYNVGLKMTAEAVGEGVAVRERKDGRIQYGVLDPAAFAQDGGPSIEERMRNGSGTALLWRRADNTRVPLRGAMGGWDHLRARLVGESEDRPMIVCFSSCEDSIRTIPVLQHDKDRIEDIDTEGEDHCFAAGTLVDTDFGPVPVEMLDSGKHRVWSSGEWRRILNPRMTRSASELVMLVFDNGARISCTPDHKFMDYSGEWRYARDLLNQEVACDLSLSAKQCRSLAERGFTGVGRTFKTKASDFIARCGSSTTGKFQNVRTSTIWMATGQTTRRKTWSALAYLLTLVSGMAKIAQSAGVAPLRMLAILPLFGTDQPLAGSGTLNTLSGTFGQSWTGAYRRFANSAGLSTWFLRRGLRKGDSVAVTVEPVRCVSVEQMPKGPSYCLSEPITQAFTIHGGMIVHNCGDEWRYACASRPWARPAQTEKTIRFPSQLTINEIIARQSRKRMEAA